jgi:hypothetical protein
MEKIDGGVNSGFFRNLGRMLRMEIVLTRVQNIVT